MQRERLDIPIRNGLKLIICPHSSDALCFYENDAEGYGESPWQLQEGKEYEYEFVDNDDCLADAWFENKPAVVIPRRRNNEGTIQTGLYVGTLQLVVIDDVLGKEHRLQLEIQSVKADYRKDYKQMLSDITEYYTELVMMQGSAVTQKFEVDNDAEPKALYQKFAFVKSIVDSDAFEEAMHKIMLNPVRAWKESTTEKHIENVKRLSHSALRQISTRTNRIQSGLIYGLDSLPRTLEVSYKTDTTDTSENQFVKHVLTQFYGFCTEIRGKKNATEQLQKEVDFVCNLLLKYIGSSFFKDISKPQKLNLNSPVLQRKEGYREILQGWLIFDLAAKLSWSGGDNVYEAGKKNVAALYEYWLFFKLLEVVSSVFNIKAVDKKSLVSNEPDQLNLDIKQGRMQMVSGEDRSGGRKLNVAFYYNRTFGHRDSIHEDGSWTMPMRPDYTLSLWPGDITEQDAEREEVIVHIHFDAKYRLNKIKMDYTEVLSDDEKEVLSNELLEEKNEQELGVYKRVDLLKMHAYKDAIRRTGGAYVLYPGDKLSNKKGFHEIIPGLGAFCISPGSESDQIPYLKQFLNEVKSHMLNRASQREKMSLQMYDIYKDEPSKAVRDVLPESVKENRDFLPNETWVVLGYVKDDKHLQWINKSGLYNFRAGMRNGSVSLNRNIVSSRYLLLHSQGKSIKFVRLSDEGPRVFRRSDLLKNGYPESKNEHQKTEDIYIVYKLDLEHIEPEWEQYYWDMLDVIKERGRNSAIPRPIQLTYLLSKAKKRL